ncbi:hypothetical protein EB061_01785 [bacterium]|jgi:hypothetical protein|nr:hypothetical protein [bacterium]
MKRSLALVILPLIAAETGAYAQPAPTPSQKESRDHFGGEIVQETPSLLRFQPNPAAREATEKMIEARERMLSSGDRNPGDLARDLQTSRGRAELMVQALKDEQFQRAIKKVTEEGRILLEQNQGLKGPASFIAGAAAFWYGTTLSLFQGDSMKIQTRIEGRGQRSEFSLESPLLNSRVVIGAQNGVQLNLNRSIASLGSSAELNYFGNTGSISTQVNHPIAPNLNLSIGASQIPEMNNRMDGRAKLEYQISF